MNIILVGISNSGKTEFAEKLAARVDGVIVDTCTPYNDAALGELSDYRTELILAGQRATDLSLRTEDDQIKIYKHSPINSVGYISARINSLHQIDQLNEGWLWALLSATSMVQDSLFYDIIIRMPDPDNLEYFDSEVVTGINSLLEELEIEKIFDPELEAVVREIERIKS